MKHNLGMQLAIRTAICPGARGVYCLQQMIRRAVQVKDIKSCVMCCARVSGHLLSMYTKLFLCA